jgi:hypothetical protein
MNELGKDYLPSYNDSRAWQKKFIQQSVFLPVINKRDRGRPVEYEEEKYRNRYDY